MDIPQYPSNSDASKRQIEEKDIIRVTSGEATRRRKPLRKQFREVFIAGDVKSSINYALFDIAFPAARDMILETFIGGVEKLFVGDRRRKGVTPPMSGPTGYVSYNRYPMGASHMPSAARALSRVARAQHDFDELILDSRTEAEQVIDRLFDVVSRYDTATVADLYQLVGLASTHSDHKWGWTDLRGAGVTRVRDGYLLDLPEPHPL